MVADRPDGVQNSTVLRRTSQANSLLRLLKMKLNAGRAL
jgi:hypothetical protein